MGRVTPLRFRAVMFYLVAAAFVIFLILPFLWMLSTSFKSAGALIVIPIQWIPRAPTVAAYAEIFEIFPFGLALRNSVYVAAMSVTITVLSCSMAAFAFAKLRFRGKEVLFAFVLATLMIPQQVTIIPLFLVLRSIGLINTFTGLLAPSVFNGFAIFLLRQHMRTIPNDYLDAARIDGASLLQMYRSVVMPMSVTSVATVGVLTLMQAWNDYFWPLIVLTKERMMTLNVALSRLNGQYSTDYATLMAGSLLSMVPIILVYAAAQKYFASGIQVGGVKE